LLPATSIFLSFIKNSCLLANCGPPALEPVPPAMLCSL
jgi:hypothetical protein